MECWQLCITQFMSVVKLVLSIHDHLLSKWDMHITGNASAAHGLHWVWHTLFVINTQWKATYLWSKCDLCKNGLRETVKRISQTQGFQPTSIFLTCERLVDMTPFVGKSSMVTSLSLASTPLPLLLPPWLSSLLESPLAFSFSSSSSSFLVSLADAPSSSWAGVVSSFSSSSSPLTCGVLGACSVSGACC